MRIIIGLILLAAIYGAYNMIAGIIADDLEDDGQTFFGAKIFTGAARKAFTQSIQQWRAASGRKPPKGQGLKTKG